MRRTAWRIGRSRSVGNCGFGTLLAIAGVLLLGLSPGAPPSLRRPPPSPAVGARPVPPPSYGTRPPPAPPMARVLPNTGPEPGGESQGLTVAIEAPSSVSDVGVAIPVEANVSGGSPPYRVAWNDSVGGWAAGGFWSVNESDPGAVEVVASVADQLGDVGESSLRLTFVTGPTLSMSATPGAVDEDLPFSLAISIAGGVPPLQVDWSIAPGSSNGTYVGGGDGTSLVSVVVTFPGPVGATADVVDAVGARSVLSTIVATSYPSPTLQLAPGLAFTDAGAAFDLEARVIGGAPPLEWTVLPSVPVSGASSSSGEVDANGSIDWQARFSTPGNDTLSITVTDANGGTASVGLPVTVLPPLSAQFLPPTGPISAESTFQVTVVISGGYPPYQWAFTSDGSTDEPAGSSWAAGNFTVDLSVGNVSDLTIELAVIDDLGGTSALSQRIPLTSPEGGAPVDPGPSLPPSLLGEAATPAAIAVSILTLLVVLISRGRRPTDEPGRADRFIEKMVTEGRRAVEATVVQAGRMETLSRTVLLAAIARLLKAGRLVRRMGPEDEMLLELPPAPPVPPQEGAP